ncbi:unnamed protein product [Amoebophrya sp. A25]|nr:unnamed protein product [Amoebophrya sp. A25]|eukprot:GSA25T00014731001.1
MASREFGLLVLAETTFNYRLWAAIRWLDKKALLFPKCASVMVRLFRSYLLQLARESCQESSCPPQKARHAVEIQGGP